MSNSRHDIVLKRPAIRREIRLFIASPSDCSQERKIIRDIADEMNEVFCQSLQVVLIPIGWENVAPSLGEPQSVIDEAIDQYDILVGVMWLRFGTPTSDGAQSGTEHEFNQAYEIWKEAGKPIVMFYFNDQPPQDMKSLDIEQYGQVRKFREKIEKVALV